MSSSGTLSPRQQEGSYFGPRALCHSSWSPSLMVALRMAWKWQKLAGSCKEVYPAATTRFYLLGSCCYKWPLFGYLFTSMQEEIVNTDIKWLSWMLKIWNRLQQCSKWRPQLSYSGATKLLQDFWCCGLKYHNKWKTKVSVALHASRHYYQ